MEWELEIGSSLVWSGRRYGGESTSEGWGDGLNSKAERKKRGGGHAEGIEESVGQCLVPTVYSRLFTCFF